MTKRFLEQSFEFVSILIHPAPVLRCHILMEVQERDVAAIFRFVNLGTSQAFFRQKSQIHEGLLVTSTLQVVRSGRESYKKSSACSGLVGFLVTLL
jgi:hypothetical protein